MRASSSNGMESMVDPSPSIDALKSGTAQEILAVVVGLLLVALVWLVRLHLSERKEWEARERTEVASTTAKLEALHEKTLAIALKVQRTILKLGDLPEED